MKRGGGAGTAGETRRFEIVLAEDNPADAELVREALEQHNVHCSLHVICDGAQAMELIDRLDADPKEPRLDLLLVDMLLPKRDGEAVLRRLRSTERYAQTPVVVISGLSSSAVEEAAIRNAAVVYFKKPAALEEFMRLGSIVRQVLEQTTANEIETDRRGAA
ncbi:MAG TPA: response regulator [Bryobacteraceae bacterium]